MSLVILCITLIFSSNSVIQQISDSLDDSENTNTEDSNSSMRTERTELENIEFGPGDTGPDSKLNIGKTSNTNNETELSLMPIDSSVSELLPLCKSDLNVKPKFLQAGKTIQASRYLTKSTDNKDWGIAGQKVDVRPNDRFQFVIHLKLNKWSTQAVWILTDSMKRQNDGSTLINVHRLVLMVRWNGKNSAVA